MKTLRPQLSANADIQPGHSQKWGLGFLINPDPYDGGRSAGSLTWAGIFNTFFWIDPKGSLCAVLLMQFLPFVDPQAIGLLADFERAPFITPSDILPRTTKPFIFKFPRPFRRSFFVS